MENQTLNTVREFLVAVQNGDQAKLGALIHPEIEWNQPGNNILSGVKRSNMEVFQMVGEMYRISEGTLLLADIKLIALNGNSAACTLHWTARKAGAELNIDNVDVYTVENGQIVAVKVFSEDLTLEDSFWGK